MIRLSKREWSLSGEGIECDILALRLMLRLVVRSLWFSDLI
jgi:hypothetical protein